MDPPKSPPFPPRLAAAGEESHERWQGMEGLLLLTRALLLEGKRKATSEALHFARVSLCSGRSDWASGFLFSMPEFFLGSPLDCRQGVKFVRGGGTKKGHVVTIFLLLLLFGHSR